jgi:hypothetical protein
MAVTPTGLYRAVIIGKIHEQLTQTALHFRALTTSPHSTHAAEASALNTRIAAILIPKFQAYASDDWQALSILTVSLIPRPGVLVETALNNATGFQPDEGLPSFCAGVLSLRSGVAGRSAHGRIYVPGTAANALNASKHTAETHQLLRDIGSTLLTEWSNTGSSNFARFCIFSRKLGVTRVLGPPVQLSYSMAGAFTVSSIIARPEIATVRRRKLQHGQ